VSIFNINQILAELFQTNTCPILGAKLVVKQAKSPIVDQCSSSRFSQGLRPKLFQWIERGQKVEGKKKRKGEKKGNKRREKKIRNESAKKSPNFGLCTCVKAKFCTIYNKNWFKI